VYNKIGNFNNISFIKIYKLIEGVYLYYDIDINDAIAAVNEIYHSPVIIDDASIKILTFLKTPESLQSGYLSFGFKYACTLRFLELLYILEKLGYDPNLYINNNENELCNIIINTLKS
jgi:hypothetical protein